MAAPRGAARAPRLSLARTRAIIRVFAGSFRDLVPIIVVIAFFQIVVLQEPFPDLERILVGLVFVVIGLALLAGRLSADEAFDVCQIDETFQIEHWGEESEAAQRRRHLHTELRAAGRFLSLLG